MIITLQVISTFFSLMMIYVSILNYKKKEINRAEFFSWLTIWFVTILIIAFPDIFRTFAQTISITRLFDLMMVGGFILVISMVTRTYIKTRRIEKEIEEMIRNDALKNFGKQEKYTKS